MSQKSCRDCGNVYPIEDYPFYSGARKNKIRKPMCRDCSNKLAREEKQRRRKESPEFYQKELERNKAYRDRYSDGYVAHKIKKREKEQTKYYTDLLWRMTAICGSAKERARRKGFEHNITPAILFVMMHVQNFRCAQTGIPFDLSASTVYDKSPVAPSLDRKDNSLGYTVQNVQLVCTWYNMMKNEWSIEDVKSFVHTAYHTMFEGG